MLLLTCTPNTSGGGITRHRRHRHRTGQLQSIMHVTDIPKSAIMLEKHQHFQSDWQQASTIIRGNVLGSRKKRLDFHRASRWWPCSRGAEGDAEGSHVQRLAALDPE